MENPLAPPPPGSPALGLFLDHFGIDPRAPAARLLTEVSTAFSRIPYENLTKIIKWAREGSAERARRGPLEVVSDHISLGAGGTCFSLTAALLHLLRALGFEAQPLLADRSYGPNTHCALVVSIGGAPHLVDPGYLIVRPVPLAPRGEVRIATPFNDVELLPREGGEKLELHTIQEGRRALRLTFKTSPVDAGEFLRAWDESFGWDMMRFLLLTRVRGSSQVYLHERRLQVRTRERAERLEVGGEELPLRIQSEFGLDPSLAARALGILHARGEKLGEAGAR